VFNWIVVKYFVLGDRDSKVVVYMFTGICWVSWYKLPTNL